MPEDAVLKRYRLTPQVTLDLIVLVQSQGLPVHIEPRLAIDSVPPLSKGTLLVETASPSTSRRSAGQCHQKGGHHHGRVQSGLGHCVEWPGCERLKKASIGFENMFEEVPIVIKNSHLINVLMWEMEQKSAVSDKQELLNLSSSNHLEKSLQLLMDRVDDMSQDIVKYNTFSRNVSKQQQQKHQNKISCDLIRFTILNKYDGIFGFHWRQINTYCQHIKEFTSQNLAKMFMAEALQGHNVLKKS
ncbi:UNVERIFIED_CONTAM: hypothetical protein FKN15_011391 [Acipenser sinensis]